MKTQQRTSAKSAMYTLTIIMLAFAFNSCQKDDLTSMNGTRNGTDEMRTTTVNSPALATVMLKIDHMAVRSMLPDYSVTLYTDGVIVFNGRKNVQFIGKARLQASTESMIAIKKIIERTSFNTISASNQIAEDLPRTITTCIQMVQPTADAVSSINASSFITKSLTDYNNGYPRALYTFRTNIENQLPIKDLIPQ